MLYGLRGFHSLSGQSYESYEEYRGHQGNRSRSGNGRAWRSRNSKRKGTVAHETLQPMLQQSSPYQNKYPAIFLRQNP